MQKVKKILDLVKEKRQNESYNQLRLGIIMVGIIVIIGIVISAGLIDLVHGNFKISSFFGAIIVNVVKWYVTTFIAEATIIGVLDAINN